MEDFFDSAYGFAAGPFRFPVSGCTHREVPTGGGMALSAFRFHEESPLAFTGGVKMTWRVGDYINPKRFPDSPKCYIDQPQQGDHPVGNPQPTTVTSYAWVYTW